MVAHHEVGLVRTKVFAPFHVDRQPSVPDHGARPALEPVVANLLRQPSLESVHDRRQRDRERLVNVLERKGHRRRAHPRAPEVTRKPSPRGASPTLAIAWWPP